MALAAFGTRVSGGDLEAEAHREEAGTPINALERLARQHHLVAEIREATVEELRGVLAAGKLPIAFLDRAVFDLSPSRRARHSIRDAIIHTVIPTRLTAKSVTFHDPRVPRVTRKALPIFRQAYQMLGGRCVVCSKPQEA
jgi:hypothetical protein